MSHDLAEHVDTVTLRELVRRSVEGSSGFASPLHRQRWEMAWMSAAQLSLFARSWGGAVVFYGEGWRLSRHNGPLGRPRWLRRYFVLAWSLLYMFEGSRPCDKCHGAIYVHRARLSKQKVDGRMAIVITPVTQLRPSGLNTEESSSFVVSVDTEKQLDAWFDALQMISSAPLSPASAVCDPFTFIAEAQQKQQEQQQPQVENRRERDTEEKQKEDEEEIKEGKEEEKEEEKEKEEEEGKSKSVIKELPKLSENDVPTYDLHLSPGQMGKHSPGVHKEVDGHHDHDNHYDNRYDNHAHDALMVRAKKSTSTESPQAYETSIWTERGTIIEAYRQQLQCLTINAATVKERIRRVAPAKEPRYLADLLLRFVMDNVEDASALWALMNEVEELPETESRTPSNRMNPMDASGASSFVNDAVRQVKDEKVKADNPPGVTPIAVEEPQVLSPEDKGNDTGEGIHRLTLDDSDVRGRNGGNEVETLPLISESVWRERMRSVHDRRSMVNSILDDLPNI